MAEVPTDVMAKRMAEAIQTDHWNTPLPVPTVDRKDKRWKSDDYWRGDVWPAPNYQIAKGLALYGHKEAAAQIADKTVANAIRNGSASTTTHCRENRWAYVSSACPAHW
jgi:putative isomerase